MKLPKLAYWVVGLMLLAEQAQAQAQTNRDPADVAVDLYLRANSPDALERMHKDLINAPEAYLVAMDQPGTLVLLNKRRVRVPAMKYNVALRLLEVRDSTGSHVWPPGSLDGFYLGKGSEARHFRTYDVRDGSVKRTFVEVLTVDDDCPLVLGVVHQYHHDDAQYDPVLQTKTKEARTEIGQVVVAGPGKAPHEPLRSIVLNQRSVVKLFGAQAAPVEAFAAKEHLSYTDLGQVMRMVEYYNQKVAK
ncbi:hypothetical protein [Hymenobacter rubidus]|uniref:hypothetical protein n=1 Tax=Hymenobacter rubidus TaxID=1441626 RepID=UPI00191D80E0|nr:hypothetical protein [Hymenobacter rubidus]